MDQESIIQQFERLGAVVRGHFTLTSGRHADTFVSKDLVSSDPKPLDRLIREVFEEDQHPEWVGSVVAAPAVGAIAFGALVAHDLVGRFVYAESINDEEVEFKRGFDKLISPGTRVLVVEDVITTGKTVRQMIAAVEKLGGVVIGVFLIWLRGERDFGDYPLVALVEKSFPTWPPMECPLCKAGVPMTIEYNKHGREFLEKYGSDPQNWPANKTA